MAENRGIDLGTTRSEIARFRVDIGKPEIIFSGGKNITRSVVMIRYDERDGKKVRQILVGDAAWRRLRLEPENAIMLVKRHMHRENPTPFVDSEGVEYTPQELSAMILRKLVEGAEESTGEKTDGVIITVPYYFRDLERRRTREAGEIAGLKVLGLMNEPEAAAIAYGLNRKGEPGRVLVFDLGGGTFDITAMDIKDDGAIEVMTSNGNRELGGADFDGLIVEHLQREFSKQTGQQCSSDLGTIYYLAEIAERMKEDLSEDDLVQQIVSSEGKSVTVQLSRQQFEEMITSKIDSTLRYIKIVLIDAWKKREGVDEDTAKKLVENLEGAESVKIIRQEWQQIDRILLVGGSTRIPLIRKRLIDEQICAVTGIDDPAEAREKAEPEDMERIERKFVKGFDPDLVVSLGAAIEANKDLITGPEIKRTMITPFALGVKVLVPERTGLEDRNDVLIRKDAKVPAETERTYSPASDYTDAVEINILQGDDPDPKNCTTVGKCLLSGFPRRRKEETKIDVKLKYDKDNIILCTAIDRDSGKEVNAEIRAEGSLSEEEIEAKRKALSKQIISG